MNIIVAKCLNNGIGFQNSLPWHFKNDLKYFAKLTKGTGNNAIIMGKNTWLSLPRRPLPKRENFILSTTLNENNCFKNISELKEYLNNQNFDEVWIIGGAKLYEQFVGDRDVNRIYVTNIEKEYECDTFFPKFSDDYVLIDTHSEMDNGVKLTYNVYEKVN